MFMVIEASMLLPEENYALCLLFTAVTVVMEGLEVKVSQWRKMKLLLLR